MTLQRGEEGELNGNGNGLKISFTIPELFKFALLLGPLIGLITYAVTLRQDVRSIAVQQVQLRTEVAEAKQGVERFDRAHLLFCTGLKRDTTLRAPDADC